MSDMVFNRPQPRGRFPDYASHDFDGMRDLMLAGTPHAPTRPHITGAKVGEDLCTAHELVHERLDGLRQAGLGAVVAPIEEAWRDAWNVVRTAAERARTADELWELDRVRSLATTGTPDPPKLNPTDYRYNSSGHWARDEERSIFDIVAELYRSNQTHLQLIDTIAESTIKYSKLLAERDELRLRYRNAVALLAALRKQLHAEVKAGRLIRGAVSRIFRAAERASS